MAQPGGICTACNAESGALLYCGTCHRIPYCSVKCCNDDWPKHQDICFVMAPYKHCITKNYLHAHFMATTLTDISAEFRDYARRFWIPHNLKVVLTYFGKEQLRPGDMKDATKVYTEVISCLALSMILHQHGELHPSVDAFRNVAKLNSTDYHIAICEDKQPKGGKDVLRIDCGSCIDSTGPILVVSANVIFRHQ